MTHSLKQGKADECDEKVFIARKILWKRLWQEIQRGHSEDGIT